MRKYLIPIAILVIGLVFLFTRLAPETANNTTPLPKVDTVSKKVVDLNPNTQIANPASQYCEENGGSLEIITNSDGSQFSMCKFDQYSCEEWAYYKKECTIEEDAQKILLALQAKGLDLTGMKVVINHHLGKYIGGSVVPISEPAGGGYVFAVKEGNEVKVVADGNGVIMCEMLEDYPNYPTFLISGCVDVDGNLVTR